MLRVTRLASTLGRGTLEVAPKTSTCCSNNISLFLQQHPRFRSGYFGQDRDQRKRFDSFDKYESRPRSRDNQRRSRPRYEDRPRHEDWEDRPRYNAPRKIQPTNFPTDLPPFQKNFYVESEKTRNRSKEEIQKFKKENEVEVVGINDEVLPVLDFDEIEFPYGIQSKLAQNYDKPSAIQSQAWPLALRGRDLIAISSTGSGKTLGFALPAITHIKAQPPVDASKGPIALVLVPTRELATQVNDAFQGVCKDINSLAVYGGVDKSRQVRDLISRRIPFLVATPGRLNDLLETGALNLDRVSYLVIDEADRMLDMGFEPQIRDIIDRIRPDRQTLMFSATWPTEVQELAYSFLNDDFDKVTIGSTELKANKDVKQQIRVVTDSERREEFLDTVQEIMDENGKALIFTSKIVEADLINEMLSKYYRRKTAALHGEKKQNVRQKILDDFKNGNIKILVATDVASRGIDVKDITHVINYDMPVDGEAYVHRIGRTGRAGRTGTAISFHLKYKDITSSVFSVLKESNVPNIEQLKRFVKLSRREKFARRASRPPGGSRGHHRDDFGSRSRGHHRNDFGGRGRGRGYRDDFGW